MQSMNDFMHFFGITKNTAVADIFGVTEGQVRNWRKMETLPRHVAHSVQNETKLRKIAAIVKDVEASNEVEEIKEILES